MTAAADPASRGSELPILDTATFDRWNTLLPADKIAAYLTTLGQLGESITSRSRRSDAVMSNREALAETAHKLAGGAAMFGLERLASISRRLEVALEVGEVGATDLANDLVAAITVTLEEIRHHTAAGNG